MMAACGILLTLHQQHQLVDAGLGVLGDALDAIVRVTANHRPALRGRIDVERGRRDGRRSQRFRGILGLAAARDERIRDVRVVLIGLRALRNEELLPQFPWCIIEKIEVSRGGGSPHFWGEGGVRWTEAGSTFEVPGLLHLARP